MSRLLSLDMDGTIVSSNENIYSGFSELAKIAKDKGYILILNTARPLIAAKWISNHANFDYLVTNNGIAVSRYPFEHIECMAYIASEIAETILNELKKYDLSVRVQYLNKGIVAYDLIEWPMDKYHYYKPSSLIEESNVIVDKVLKISLFGNINFFQNSIKRIARKFSLKAYCSKSNLMEIVPTSFEKFDAIQYIIDEYENDTDMIICVGDGENDKASLQKATIGITFFKASETVKRSADIIVMAPENDGLKYIASEII